MLMLYDLLFWGLHVLCYVWWRYSAWISRREFVDFWEINYFFMIRGFYPYYKWNSAEFSIDFPVLEILRFHGLQVFVFQMGLSINMSCVFLGGVLENRDPLKGTVARVRPMSRDMTFLIFLLLVCDIHNKYQLWSCY